jgi:hypothetical protein
MYERIKHIYYVIEGIPVSIRQSSQCGSTDLYLPATGICYVSPFSQDGQYADPIPVQSVVYPWCYQHSHLTVW